MATHSTVWTGVLSQAGAALPVGYGIVKNGNTYLAATTANRASYGRTVGISLTAASAASGSFEFQVAGVMANSLTGLGAGSASWVRVSTTGTLERCTPASGDDIVGKCNTAGDLTIVLGTWDSDNTSANAQVDDDIDRSGGAGTAIDRVKGFYGAALSAATANKGEQYSYNGTQHIPTRRALHIRQFLNSAPNADFAGGGTDFAAAIEQAIESADTGDKEQALVLEFDGAVGAGYRLSRTVRIRRSVRIVGQSGSMQQGCTTFVADEGVTAFRIVGLSDDPEAPSGVHGVSFDNVRVQSSGQLATTGTCDYTAGDFEVPLTSGAGDWEDGQLIAIDGVGHQCTLARVTAETSTGSPTVELTGHGDLTPVIRAGDYLIIGTAYTTPTRVTNRTGTTLTMASNAATTLAAEDVIACMPLVARIDSGGGTTTLTIDAYAGAVSMNGATIRHYDAAFDILGKVRFQRVGVGDPYSTGKHFAGPAFALRGDHANVPASTGVNCSSLLECESYGNKHAVFAVGADTNGCLLHVHSHQSAGWSFVDLSHLGNTYLACHVDGGQGFISHDVANCAVVAVGCYQEGGTFSSFGPGAIIVGGTMPIDGGGYSLHRLSPRTTAPRYGVSISGDVTYDATDTEFFAESIEYVGSPASNVTLTFPYAPDWKPKWIWNNLTTDKTITVTTAIGTSVIIPKGYGCFVQTDSVNIRRCTPLVRIGNSTEHLIAETRQTSRTWSTDDKERISTAQTTTASANQVIEDGLYGTDGAQDFTLEDNAITRVECFIIVKKSATAAGGTIEVKADYYRSGGSPTIIGAATITYNLVGSTLDATTVDLNVSGNVVQLRASPESADTLNWRIYRRQRQRADA